MIETLKNAWKIADLRKKLLYTLMIVLIFRIGSVIPLPYMDPSAIQSMINADGSLFGYLNILSGGSFGQATVFALSISPYITSSIVIQLLSVAIPYLERLAKEGEDGRKRLNKITRYTTIGLALFQSIAYYFMFRNMNAVAYRGGFEGVETLPYFAFVFGGDALELLHQGVQLAFLAEDLDTELLHFGRSLGAELLDALQQLVDSVNHGYCAVLYIFVHL